MALTTSTAYTQLLTIQNLKGIDFDGLISQMNMILSNPNASTNDVPQIADFNGKIQSLQALAASLQLI